MRTNHPNQLRRWFFNPHLLRRRPKLWGALTVHVIDITKTDCMLLVRCVGLGLALLAPNLPAATLGTAFTYQGSLENGGNPANGIYDFTFTLYDAANGGSVVGGPLTQAAIGVTNGLFTSTLDFGSGIFTGSAQWLELGVRTNGVGPYTTLTPRQQLTPTPNAIYASNSGVADTANGVALNAVNNGSLQNNSVTANKVAPGQVVKTLNGLTDSVSLQAGSNVSLVTNGNTLTISSSSSGDLFWALGGNAGTIAGPNFVGTTDNQPLEMRVDNGRVARFEFDPILIQSPNVILGHEMNMVPSGVIGGTIGGGGGPAVNTVFGNFGTIAGGQGNQAGHSTPNPNDTAFAAVGGGYLNSASGPYSTVGGGNGNLAGDYGATVAGGHANQAPISGATVAGGANNVAGGSYAAISGGTGNSASGVSASIGGGQANRAQGIASTISGGIGNTARDDDSTVGGGENNNARGVNTTVAGGFYNQIVGDHSGIAGGLSNSVSGVAAFVGGGAYNLAQGTATVIGGGQGNITRNLGTTIAGGNINWAFGSADTVGGGFANVASSGINPPNSGGATIAGGVGNYATNVDAFVGGGAGNISSGYASTVSGGHDNVANQGYSTVGGGQFNYATASGATVLGGEYNLAGGVDSTASGYDNYAGGDYSFAAGRFCNIQHGGCFMWSDGTLSFTTFTPNGFYALATGGYYLFTGSGVGVQVFGGGNAWSAISDRNMKENFEPVDCRAILDKVVALPLTTWNLKTQTPDIRHIGVMAQDFKTAFEVGEDDRHISTSDADGVAMAAIQGLNQKLDEQRAQLQARQAQIEELTRRLDQLERLVSATNH